jgi:phosphatidylserine decarboxylase
MWILNYLPRKWLSRLVGKLAFFRFPPFIQEKINYQYARFFNVNLNETEFPFYDYSSLGDFFIRRLKPGARPIGKCLIIHPCDSRVTQHGVIKDSQLIQAKGINYSLQGLTGYADIDVKFNAGYFLTYYLSPKDYHRVHSPISGMITHIHYIRGDLWPVNDWSIANIPKVYSQNERVYVEIATEFGPVAVIFVGATNVGSIVLKFDRRVFTNWKMDTQIKKYEPAIPINKGDELGLFKMGSTVIALYNPEFYQKFKSAELDFKIVKVGQDFFDPKLR